MAKAGHRRAVRVQVYFENFEMEAALRREARAGRVSLSRAAERAIERGLQRRPQADPEDRLLRLDRALRGHMRSTARDMTIVQELIVELARALFLRLPDSPADADALLQAVAAARVERMLDAAAARIAAGERREAEQAAVNGEARGVEAESRSFGASAQ